MKKLLFLIMILLLISVATAAPPTRQNTYTAGETISSANVTANEDAIFNYLTAGIDTIKDGIIVNADVNSSANIQSSKLNLTAMSQSLANTGTFSNTGDVTITGNITVSGTNNIIPSGAIFLWSGAVSAIPTGYVICDGNNGTPNLTDRFVIHADADSGGTRDVGDTGGSHTTTLTTTELPAHTHNIDLYGHSTNSAGGIAEQSDNATGATTDATSSAGSGSAFNTLPKFYALAYIMKT